MHEVPAPNRGARRRVVVDVRPHLDLTPLQRTRLTASRRARAGCASVWRSARMRFVDVVTGVRQRNSTSVSPRTWWPQKQVITHAPRLSREAIAFHEADYPAPRGTGESGARPSSPRQLRRPRRLIEPVPVSACDAHVPGMEGLESNRVAGPSGQGRRPAGPAAVDQGPRECESAQSRRASVPLSPFLY
jgi:hypothetical protein